MTDDYRADMALMVKAAEKAGTMAMKTFRADPSWRKKAGGEPVSETDLAIDLYLRKTLIGARPDYGWLSEETADDGARLNRPRVFIVDPIDGTRAFLNGTADFSVCVGLVENGRPVAGVMVAPAAAETYAAAKGCGATLNGGRLEAKAARGAATLYASKGTASRLGATPAPFPNSTALRIAHAAAGRTDGVVILAARWEWDVAAADVILEEAGGRMVDRNGNLWVYNAKRPRREGVIAGPDAFPNDALARLEENGRRD